MQKYCEIEIERVARFEYEPKSVWRKRNQCKVLFDEQIGLASIEKYRSRRKENILYGYAMRIANNNSQLKRHFLFCTKKYYRFVAREKTWRQVSTVSTHVFIRMKRVAKFSVYRFVQNQIILSVLIGIIVLTATYFKCYDWKWTKSVYKHLT